MSYKTFVYTVWTVWLFIFLHIRSLFVRDAKLVFFRVDICDQVAWVIDYSMEL